MVCCTCRKKVLVVHPFEESIQDQYKHFDKLFPCTDILPEFELKTLKAVQTAGSAVDPRFPHGLTHLTICAENVKKLTLTSPCLAVVPTAIRWPPTSKMGKQAIHLGGCLQILFGLKGRRWDEEEPDIVAMYNDYWHYPMASEVPKGSGDVEGGTYWKKNS